MIVVTGSTGHVGGELVSQLAGRGVPVRAMTRRPEAATFPAGVEVVYGDAADPASLDAAFAGAEGAFLMSAQPVGSAPTPTHMVALVDAGRRAGVRRVAQLSVLGGGSAQPGLLGEWHEISEAAVVDSGMDWTLLRPGRFFSNAMPWAQTLKRGDTLHIPFAHRPTASIDPYDIAAVAAEALTTGDHAKTRYELSGPEVLTPVQEVEILGGLLGRSLQVIEPPVEAFREGMLRSGMTEDVVAAILDVTSMDERHGAEVLPTVPQVLGRPARSFTDWVRAHIGLFTEGESR
jgi:uncharacterized protein YbjT (DUF2867 family)